MSAKSGRALILRPSTAVTPAAEERRREAVPLALVATPPRDRRQGKRLPSTAGRGRVVDLRI